MIQGYEKEDIDRNRALCAFGYFTFYLPLLIKDSRFARFHANQALVLFLFTLVIGIISTVFLILIHIVGAILFFALLIFTFIMMLCGFANAANGRVKRLPMIGSITLLRGSNNIGAVEEDLAAKLKGKINTNQTIECPNCGFMVDKTKKFCGHCGAKIVVKERICAQCNTPVAEGLKFCGNCGAEYVEPEKEPKVEERKCPNCGRIAEGEEVFCMKCGTKISGIE